MWPMPGRFCLIIEIHAVAFIFDHESRLHFLQKVSRKFFVSYCSFVWQLKHFLHEGTILVFV